MFFKHTFSILLIPMVLGLTACASSTYFDDAYNLVANDYSEIRKTDEEFFTLRQDDIVEAKVLNIDYVSRVMTLDINDMTIELLVTTEARNFDEIVIGDTVIIGYIVNLAIEVLNENDLDYATNLYAGSSTSKMPEKLVRIKDTIVATVLSIDQEMQTFELEGPGGVVIEYTAAETDNLQLVEQYDIVTVSQTQIIALNLDIEVVEYSSEY